MNVAIYQQNEAQMTSDLSPPQRRMPKFLAWLSCFFNPLQWDHDLLFLNGWTDGSNAVNWSSGSNYSYQNRVIDINGSVYECYKVAGLINDTVNPYKDTANWFKVLDNFIGIRERANYTGQHIYVEFLLNRFFQVGNVLFPFTGASHVNQIFIGPIVFLNSFWLTNGESALPSYLNSSSRYATNFLRNKSASSYNYRFTIFCPAAIATAVGNNHPLTAGNAFWNSQSTVGFTTAQVRGGNAIMSLAAKYIQANYNFNFEIY